MLDPINLLVLLSYLLDLFGVEWLARLVDILLAIVRFLLTLS